MTIELSLFIKNSDVSETRNTGLKVCSGELITFVAVDDYLIDSSIHENDIHVYQMKKFNLIG